MTKFDLQNMVLVLNRPAGDPVRDQLRQLLADWKAAGNLENLLANDPILDHCLREEVVRPALSLEHGLGGGAEVNLIFGDVMPFTEMIKKFYHRKDPQAGAHDWKAYREAVLRFAQLMFSKKDRALLQGPCQHCGQFWIPKRWLRQNTYCSQKCGQAVMVKRNYERKRQQKLARVRAALKRFKFVRTEQDWKTYVSRQIRIDKRFITQAVRRGEIEAPKKGGHHAGNN